MSSPDDARPEGPPPGDVAPVESEPVGAEVPQPPAAADDARSDEPPAPEPEPVYDELRGPVLDALKAKLGDAVVASESAPGLDVWVRVRIDAWAETARVLRQELGFTYFCFLSAIDWLPSPFGTSQDDAAPAAVDPSAPLDHGTTGGETRLQLFARVEKPGTNLGVTIKADVPDDDPSAPTWSQVYFGANWHERETWEMFGISFIGHPQLTHLYLPGQFEGYPLRKDFPLLARMVKPWPGLVDVEPMPGEDPEDAEAEADA